MNDRFKIGSLTLLNVTIFIQYLLLHACPYYGVRLSINNNFHTRLILKIIVICENFTSLNFHFNTYHRNKGNQKLFFRVLKLLRKEKSKNAKQIKTKKGDTLIKEKEIMNE